MFAHTFVLKPCPNVFNLEFGKQRFVESFEDLCRLQTATHRTSLKFTGVTIG